MRGSAGPGDDERRKWVSMDDWRERWRGRKMDKERTSREEQSRNRKVSFWIITGGTFTAGTKEGLYMGLRVKLMLEFGSEERSRDSAEV